MIFGNGAPAPFSVTCAAAGAAASNVARASDVIRFMRSLVLERELHLEKGTLAARVLQRRCATFEREQVHVAEHPDVGLDLIRETGDDARLLVVRRVRIGIHDIDASDGSGFTAAAIGRVDVVDPDTDTPDNKQTRVIAGLSYQIQPNIRVLGDVDLLSFEGGATPLEDASRQRALFQMQFTF